MKNTERNDQWAEMAELVDSVRREVERERERLVERVERMDVLLKIMESTGEQLEEIETLKEALRDRDEQIEDMHGQIEEKDERMKTMQQELDKEKEQRAKLEMQLSEMSKLSAGVAKKASQDELLKALRVFVNKSKRKRPEKRTAVKEIVLELANANGIVWPEDLATAIDCLDDEQPETKEVHNHFESGSNAQVFNGKVDGKFEK